MIPIYGTIETLPLGKENLYAILTGMLREKSLVLRSKIYSSKPKSSYSSFPNEYVAFTLASTKRGNSLAILNPFVYPIEKPLMLQSSAPS